MDIDVISYCTFGDPELGDNGFYERCATTWLDHHRRSLGVDPQLIYLRTSAVQPPWLVNTRRKALVIAAARRGRPLLWIDVDDRLDEMPDIPPGADVAGIPSMHADRELSAGVLYFATTEAADALVASWALESLAPGNAGKSDEWCLNKAIQEMRLLGIPLRAEPLNGDKRYINESRERGRNWPSSQKGIDYGAAIR